MAETDSDTYKVPPQNIEAEQSVLGCILIENESIEKIIEILDRGDFYRESHCQIFEAIHTLYERGEPVDLVTLSDHMRGHNLLESVGGASYMSSLANMVPSAANIAHYARLVREKAIRRRMIVAAAEIAEMAYDDPGDVDESLDQAERKIFEVSEQRSRPSFFPINDIVKVNIEKLMDLYERQESVTGVPTGFKDLDVLTAGFQPSDLIIIAGRPSMGKTALALNMAQYVGMNPTMPIPVGLFSLEMSKEQLVNRMLCSEAKVNGSNLRRGFLSERDWSNLTSAAGKLSEAPIFIDDTPAITVLEMRAKARRLKKEHGLGMVVVDYLQLMRGKTRGRSDSREQEISDISRSLKALAKELNIPVVALSQLNRGVESRTDKRPLLSDLRESGAIEQDADVIAFIYRDEVYNPNSEDNKNVAELLVSKQRNGPIGKVMLTFLNQYTLFQDHTASDVPGDVRGYAGE